MWQWTDTDTKLPPRKIHSPFLKINKMELQRSFLSLSPLFYISQFEYTRKTQLWWWRACHSSQGPFRRRVPKLRLSTLSTCMSVKWLIFQLESLPFQFIAPNFHFQSHWLTLALEKTQTQGPQDVGGLDVLQTPSDHSEFNTSQHPFSKPFACRHPNNSKDM